MMLKGLLVVLCLSLSPMYVKCLTETELTKSNWFSKLLGRCIYEGKIYIGGETFDEHYDATQNTMSYKKCKHDGSMYAVVIPNYLTTTPPPTTTPQLPGCYHDGKYYQPDEQISSGQSGNWCYGLFCGGDGHLLHWDNFNCGPTTPTTTMPPTSSPRTA